MARYVLTVDTTGEQLNDGPLLTSPMGGVITYSSIEEASEAAKQLVAGGTVQGAYVHILRPMAFYMPLAQGKIDWPDTESHEGN